MAYLQKELLNLEHLASDLNLHPKDPTIIHESLIRAVLPQALEQEAKHQENWKAEAAAHENDDGPQSMDQQDSSALHNASTNSKLDSCFDSSLDRFTRLASLDSPVGQHAAFSSQYIQQHDSCSASAGKQYGSLFKYETITDQAYGLALDEDVAHEHASQVQESVQPPSTEVEEADVAFYHPSFKASPFYHAMFEMEQPSPPASPNEGSAKLNKKVLPKKYWKAQKAMSDVPSTPRRKEIRTASLTPVGGSISSWKDVIQAVSHPLSAKAKALTSSVSSIPAASSPLTTVMYPNLVDPFQFTPWRICIMLKTFSPKAFARL